MIKQVDLKECFSSYDGGKDYEAALEFIKNKFRSMCQDKSKEIYMMETTAVDSGNMRFILQSMVSIVASSNLEAYERMN